MLAWVGWVCGRGWRGCTGLWPVVMVAAVGESAAGTATAGGVHGFAPVLTSFVGRASAVDQVAALLSEGRLVTVTGPGGVGKTRLAREVARAVAGRFADGVWLAELAAVADPAQVAPVVAVTLEVHQQPGVLAAEALARVLARQQLLLVLDNCEHVIGAAAELCAGLVAAADDVRILATSREPLRVAGEACYRLGPLGLPGAEDADGSGSGEGEAVALFADRARRADAHFTLSGEDGPVVARLVARLDGMPLAIELAAARVEALGVAGLLERIEDRFALLVAGDRLATGRHRSLAATVDWSYQLLDDHERRLFRQVSVFAGPFTLEAAEAVAGQGVAPVVARLVDCSLLSPPREGPDGRARYVMLDTLRAYGAGLLAEAGEQDKAAAALAGYALRVAEQAAGGLQTSSGEAAAARWLDAEDAMVRQVLAWAMEHDQDVALRLAVALAPWWLLRGQLPGQYPLLRQVAGHAEPGSDRWCIAQFWLGYTALHSADLAGALGHFTAVSDAIGERPPSRALADCLSRRSRAFSELGRIAEAVADGRRSLTISRGLDYPAGEVLALVNLAIAALYVGDGGRAVRLVQQAGQVPADIPGWIARVRSTLLTLVLIEAGDPAAAEPICAAGLSRSRDIGDLWNLGSLLTYMAILDLQAGRTDDARSHLNEALHIGLRAGGHNDLLEVLDWCGHLCTAVGLLAEAVTVWAAFAALHQQEGIMGAPAGTRRRQDSLSQAWLALGADRARAAEARGAVMSLDTATEYALLLTAPGPQASAAQMGAGKLSARERSWSPWSPKAPPTPRSPPSCTSASAPSAPTWTASGTRPAAADAPTSPAWP
jgi:predicted ATPase